MTTHAPPLSRRVMIGAEAVLQLRVVRANGDFDAYWSFHLNQERHRVHESRYNSRVIPVAG